MKVTEEDLALETLRMVRAEVLPDLGTELVEKCYAIQKTNQFNPDRAFSSQLMDKLIDAYVDQLVSQETEGASE